MGGVARAQPRGQNVCQPVISAAEAHREVGKHRAGSNFRFAVLMAGRGPIISLDPDLVMNSALIDASQVGLSHYPDQ